MWLGWKQRLCSKPCNYYEPINQNCLIFSKSIVNTEETKAKVTKHSHLIQDSAGVKFYIKVIEIKFDTNSIFFKIY